MSAHVLDSDAHRAANAELVARLERLPVTRRLLLVRVIIGIATFFDAYTVLCIAFAMPSLVSEWKLSPAEVGLIISAGYIGQLFGAVIFGSLAEKFGRLKVLFFTIVLFVSMDIACLFAWSGMSMLAFRFMQGIGTGGEVPVASAYINEFIGAHKRGRFFLLYEVIFPIGLMFAGMAGFFLVPIYGWKAMFLVGLVPSVLTLPLRWFMPESPRWLASKGRIDEANAVVGMLENDAIKHGLPLPEPVIRTLDPKATAKSDWRELFQGIYLKRTLTIWSLWFCAYMVNNGLITWLPTLYKSVFKLPLQTSLAYGWITSGVGVLASIVCALLIDKVGRRPWYSWAFLLAMLPLILLTTLGATSPVEVLILATCAYAILQTVTFSLYLYSSELYPTRLRALGTGFGSAWLRAGSATGPILVGFVVGDLGIRYVFSAFAAIALIGGIITVLYAIETKGKVLEELSP
ncbi:MFS transporter [Propionivibrio dicarboxylicus]|uniref:MFS transporter, putative metabolite:H+ symporter n=1 Tax=Propionivibrio dicarboxylicus TaxID=83767 RepID=A0A1G7YKB9_9RHOO|nr:MFS transporter [Propionivibrio dicarboxylicus]SDG96755.1 MFS transporter, putative metabolite:H+ symporter [Propionivibrio dicarboxylicus]